VQADQAIFTSLGRRGKSGYHLVARSPGLSENEATTLARWCPSHDGLIVDAANRVSINFHPLPGGRHALARTCRGRPEYSGRGWQVYTHVMVIDLDVLRHSGFRPFRVYRDALALGYLHYRPDPPAVLPRVPLLTHQPRRDDSAWSVTARALGVPVFDTLVSQLNAGQDVIIPFAGDREALADSLLQCVEPTTVLNTSFATSLHPSTVRPFRLHIVAPTPATGAPVGNPRK
jgi:hypothetical protein